MLFEFLCKEKTSFKVFSENKVLNLEELPALSYHLFYRQEVDSPNVLFVELFPKIKNIYDVLPLELHKDIVFLDKKLDVFRKTFKTIKVSKTVNEYELLPIFFLKNFFWTRVEVAKFILGSYSKPIDYDFLLELKRLCFEIEKYDLVLTNKLQNEPKNIYYQLFGTLTGRLSTGKNSFPILSISKDKRKDILPNNDVFVELDFNSTDVRFFLFLSGVDKQPGDIHEYHREIINKKTGCSFDRNEAKGMFLSWLYGSKSLETDLSFFDQFYEKDKVLKTYDTNDGIKNPFGVEIKAEERRRLPLLVQSTAASVFFRQAIRVWKYIKHNNLKSKLCFLIHDAIVIDFIKSEKHHLNDIKKIFGETDMGSIPVHVRVGKNFGEMTEL